jgi:hypothetical protein
MHFPRVGIGAAVVVFARSLAESKQEYQNLRVNPETALAPKQFHGRILLSATGLVGSGRFYTIFTPPRALFTLP